MEKKFSVTGRFRVRDLETRELKTVHIAAPKEQKEMEDRWAYWTLNWKHAFQRNRVDTIDVTTGEPYIAQMLSYFKTRAKRFR